MKRLYAVLFIAFVLVACVWAQEALIIKAPGIAGMNTDTDAQNLSLQQARVLLNTDTRTEPGVMKKRNGHKAFGATNKAVSGAVALYDPLSKWKAAALIIPTITIQETGYASDLSGTWTTVDSTITIGGAATNDTVLGIVGFTAQSSVVIDDTAGQWWVAYADNHDFTIIPEGIVFTSPDAPVGLISASTSSATYDTTVDSFYNTIDTLVDTTIIILSIGRWVITYDTVYDTTINVRDSVAAVTVTVLVDSFRFEPRIVPLSPEAPGTLRTFAVSATTDSTAVGDLQGIFQYATFFSGSNRILLNDLRSIKVDSGFVVLSHFPRDVHNSDSSYTVIIRRRIDIGGQWETVDTIRYAHTASQITYIDDRADPATALDPDIIWNDGWFGGDSDYGKTGGKIAVQTIDSVGHPVENSWDSNSAYYFAYSYLDTLLHVESPLSIITRINSPDTLSAALAKRKTIKIGYSGGWHVLRLYRTLGQPRTSTFDIFVHIDPQAGTKSGDLEFYAVKDMSLDGWGGVMIGIVGNVADTTLQDGNLIVDETGSAIIRPTTHPFITGNPSTFKDVEFWNDRLWGIGDPEFPSRLWYSADLEYEDWGGFNFLDLDEHDNDLIVAMERVSVGSSEALLVFKRRKIFIVYGSLPSDLEFLDGSLWGSFADISAASPIGDLTVAILSHSVGAIHKDLVVKRGDEVYFVTNGLEMVRTRGTRLDTISRGVLIQLKATLTTAIAPEGGRHRPSSATSVSYSASDVKARMMIHGDEIVVMNQTDQDSALGMAWNTVNETWSSVKYMFSNAIPRGTFKYDTVTSPDLFGDDNDLFFFKGYDDPFRLETDTLWGDGGNGYGFSYRSPLFVREGRDLFMRSLRISYAGEGPVATVRVLSSTGDTLATSTLTMSAGRRTDMILGFARHGAAGVSFQIDTDATIKETRIYELQPDIVTVGRTIIE